jgi:hypothetical protein
MEKEIKNLNVNTKAFEEAAKKKKKFRRRVASLFLIATLATGGYLLKDPILNFYNTVVVVNELPRVDDLGLIVEAEGKVIIDDVEHDLAELKEKYGPSYHFIVPMTEEEINRKFDILIQSERQSIRYNETNDIMVLYTLVFSEEQWPEYDIISMKKKAYFTDSILDFRANTNKYPNSEFIKYVARQANCSEFPSYSGKYQCYLELDENYISVLLGHKSKNEISLKSKEFHIKKYIFEYELFVKAIDDLGYNINDYSANSKTNSIDSNLR